MRLSAFSFPRSSLALSIPGSRVVEPRPLSTHIPSSDSEILKFPETQLRKQWNSKAQNSTLWRIVINLRNGGREGRGEAPPRNFLKFTGTRYGIAENFRTSPVARERGGRTIAERIADNPSLGRQKGSGEGREGGAECVRWTLLISDEQMIERNFFKLHLLRSQKAAELTSGNFRPPSPPPPSPSPLPAY